MIGKTLAFDKLLFGQQLNEYPKYFRDYLSSGVISLCRRVEMLLRYLLVARSSLAVAFAAYTVFLFSRRQLNFGMPAE